MAYKSVLTSSRAEETEAYVTVETPQNNEPNNDTAVEVDYVLALYPYRANGTNELSFTQGDTLEVLNKE